MLNAVPKGNKWTPIKELSAKVMADTTIEFGGWRTLEFSEERSFYIASWIGNIKAIAKKMGFTHVRQVCAPKDTHKSSSKEE